MIAVAEVRQRVKARIASAARNAAERRAPADTRDRTFDEFLQDVAVPVFRMTASALAAEGYPFTVSTPAGRVQLLGRSASDTIELELDAAVDPAVVLGRTTRTRGRRTTTVERPLRPDLPLALLTDLDVLDLLLTEIAPFVEP